MLVDVPASDGAYHGRRSQAKAAGWKGGKKGTRNEHDCKFFSAKMQLVWRPGVESSRKRKKGRKEKGV